MELSEKHLERPLPSIWLIAAMGLNRVIGVNNALPWRLKSDLQYFKRTTLGQPILMGRKTFDSLGRKPLPMRKNLVVSRSVESLMETSLIETKLNTLETDQSEPVLVQGAYLFCDVFDAVKFCSNEEKIFVIGGEQLYKYALENLPIAGVLLTLVHKSAEGDAFFPEFESKFKLTKAMAGVENGTLIEWQTWVGC